METCHHLIIANKSEPRLVCAPVWRKPLVGLPGVGSSCPARHHPGVHGPTDYCCDRQQEGAQAEGTKETLLTKCGLQARLMC